jgi:hypothetical protein
VIKFWDLRDTRSPVYNTNPIQNSSRKYGIGYLKINNVGDKLYASGMNSRIYELDTVGLENVKTYSHPDFDNSSFFIKFDISPCGIKFLI